MPILGTLIWVYPNLTSNKTEFTIKRNVNIIIRKWETNVKFFLDTLMIILGHHCVVIWLAKMLIWAFFSQSRCTFSFRNNPYQVQKIIKTSLTSHVVLSY